MLKEFRTTDLVWDKASKYIYDNVRASSSDEKGRRLVVQIYNNGIIEDLQGYELNLSWESLRNGTNGLDVFTALDAKNGLYELYYTTGMLSNIGKLRANLYLTGGSSAITSEPFTLEVFEGVDMKAVEVSDSFSTLSGYINRINGIEHSQVEWETDEEARKSNEVDRREAEVQRRNEETKRVNAEKARVTADEGRDTKEGTREAEEAKRVTAEGSRVKAEGDRVTAESDRNKKEQERVAVEVTREEMEDLRNTYETERDTAEGKRVTAESKRVEDEGKRDTAEGKRVTEEGKRVTAESGRVTTENARVTAENGRVTEEGKRVTAESLRVSKDKDRDTSEGVRVKDEDLRKTAEQARVDAEKARVTADEGREDRIIGVEDMLTSKMEYYAFTTQTAPRPETDSKVMWVGTVTPTYRKNGDIFINTNTREMYTYVISTEPVMNFSMKIGGSPNAMEVVNHGTNANMTRPSGATAVYWVGSVEPTKATENDIWVGGK